MIEHCSRCVLWLSTVYSVGPLPMLHDNDNNNKQQQQTITTTNSSKSNKMGESKTKSEFILVYMSLYEFRLRLNAYVCVYVCTCACAHLASSFQLHGHCVKDGFNIPILSVWRQKKASCITEPLQFHSMRCRQVCTKSFLSHFSHQGSSFTEKDFLGKTAECVRGGSMARCHGIRKWNSQLGMRSSGYHGEDQTPDIVSTPNEIEDFHC